MMASDDVQSRILRCLKGAYPKDLTIKEIAKACGISRNTASKYLLLLTANGKVEYRSVGRAKMFTLTSVAEGKIEKSADRTEKEIAFTLRLEHLKWLLLGRFSKKLVDQLEIVESDGILKVKPRSKLGDRFSDLRKLIEELGGRFNAQDNSFEIKNVS